MLSEITKLISAEHYLALMLILIFACILKNRAVLSEQISQDSFWITITVCVLLIIQDLLDNYAQLDPARRDLRLISSIAGYTLLPAAVLGFLLVIWPAEWHRWFLWIPVVLNGLLYYSALFTPLTFSFDDHYALQPGPLGRVVFVVCIVYLLLILVAIHVRFRNRRFGDIFVIYLCVLGCMGAMAADVLFGGVTLLPAILISSLVFYMFLRAQDMDYDPLTRLWNRRIFYEDCRKNRSTVTAVVSADMNGLKKINDELGHDAGDRALRMIAHSFHSIINRKISAYRIGGDEFMILFFQCGEEDVRQAITAFLNEIWKVGQSVAIGVASKQECGESLEEMIRLSDYRMYQDKSRYYQVHDRRRNEYR